MNETSTLETARAPATPPAPDRAHLLNSKQMAKFVADGFLRFDEIVPRPLCEELLSEIDAGVYGLGNQRPTDDAVKKWGAPFSGAWPDSLAVSRIFRSAAVRGIIESLAGPNCRFDHHYLHTIKGPSSSHQNIHQDSEIDPRESTFDIQISLFPQDTTEESGGTLFIPSSHFRRVHEHEVGRYQNIVGQVQAVCKAGTLYVWHHNLWHAGRANRSPTTRHMFKLRLQPTIPQIRLWNTDDLDDAEVEKILATTYPWHGQTGRIEWVNRMKLWRVLTGDPKYDTSFFLKRIENDPLANGRESGQ